MQSCTKRYQSQGTTRGIKYGSFNMRIQTHQLPNKISVGHEDIFPIV